MALKHKYLLTFAASLLMVLFLIVYNNYAQSPKEKLLDKNKVTNQSQDPLEYIKLGFNYLQQNNFNQASASCEKAISLIPGPFSKTDKDNLFKAHDLLAQIYGEQNKIDMAIDEYREALNFNPKSDYIYYKMGVLYANKGMYSEAKDLFKKVIEIGENGESEGVVAGYAKQALERMQDR
jgi:Tfp pilus assembly protein PilF